MTGDCSLTLGCGSYKGLHRIVMVPIYTWLWSSRTQALLWQQGSQTAEQQASCLAHVGGTKDRTHGLMAARQVLLASDLVPEPKNSLSNQIFRYNGFQDILPGQYIKELFCKKTEILDTRQEEIEVSLLVHFLGVRKQGISDYIISSLMNSNT